MIHELTQRFFFEAAHTLQRRYAADASRRVHGHTYRSRVTVAGTPDPDTGMLLDLARLREAIEQVRLALDHRLLDDVADLGPATLENLCSYIHRHLAGAGWRIACVEVEREASGDSCALRTGDWPGEGRAR